MRRLVMNELIAWKSSRDRMPLILDGVRQCGKTYILTEFGKEQYENTVYLNFEKTPSICGIFKGDFDARNIISKIELATDSRAEPEKTLIILDEIQICPRALASLKYLCEDAPEYHIACAGSLLGLLIHGNGENCHVPFPVGKVNRISMYPMTFPEFLLAKGMDRTYTYLRDLRPGEEILETVKEKAEEALREYLVVGGMPKAVKAWTENRSLDEVNAILRNLLLDYADDFGKYAIKDLRNLTLLWNSVPEQLARDNRKFFFGHAKKGARGKNLENSLQWLTDSHLVYKAHLTENPRIPLSACADPTYFKIYMADLGLLRIKSGYPARFVADSDPSLSVYKGAAAENYVCCELAALGKGLYFWRDGRYEVDFLYEYDGNIIPLEVKSENDRRSASLNAYCGKYGPEMSAVVAMLPPGAGKRTVIPLFLVWNIENFVKAELEKDSRKGASADS